MKNKLFFFCILFLFIATNLYSGDYSITAPNGWSKKAGAALAQYQKGTGTFILTADNLPANANSPDAYTEFVKGKLKGVFKEITFESVQKGKNGNYETRELNYLVKVSGMVLKYKTLYVFTKNKAYTLTSSNIESAINKEYEADIKTFFSSFKIN